MVICDCETFGVTDVGGYEEILSRALHRPKTASGAHALLTFFRCIQVFSPPLSLQATEKGLHTQWKTSAVF